MLFRHLLSAVLRSEVLNTQETPGILRVRKINIVCPPYSVSIDMVSIWALPIICMEGGICPAHAQRATFGQVSQIYAPIEKPSSLNNCHDGSPTFPGEQT